MLVKVLGIADLLTALVFFTSSIAGFIPDKLVLIVGLYILIKGIIFILIFDFASFIDVTAGIVILFSLAYNVHMIIIAIVALYLIQKGIISLMS